VAASRAFRPADQPSRRARKPPIFPIASFEFLGFAAIAAIVYNLGSTGVWRQAVLLIASVCFLATFSPSLESYIPFAAFLILGYLGVRTIEGGARGRYLATLFGTIAVFIWLKKYTFLSAAIFLDFPYVTIGLSYIFFRVLHLMIDVHSGDLPGDVSLFSYLNYTLNFTTLVSGPIQRYEEFAAMQAAPIRLNIMIMGNALQRIIVGFFKVNILSVLLLTVQHRSLDDLSAVQHFAVRVATGVLIGGIYPLFLYCNFSGYMDMVIGIARFLGLELPENFDRPFSATNFIDFWNRWHITLSTWLKTYVYNPLLIALMARVPSSNLEPLLGVFAYFVTFFLIGVWHGRTSVFVVFGVLQGLGVSVNKLYQITMTKLLGRKSYRDLTANPVYKAFCRGFTFSWFALSLFCFWSNWAKIESMINALKAPAITVMWIVLLIGATVALAVFDAARQGALSLRWNGVPILLSRYFCTVWDTALVTISVAAILLVHVPTPDIVYKAF
jgi:D-alanyl-lipoteichoic acid acyltransferase DltB (MBOAT superfamily)